MSFGFPVLLGSQTLAPRYRWRLVDVMFAAWRPAVEGSCAVGAVALICLLQTGNTVFAALLVINIMVLAARLLLARYYARVCSANGRRSHSPEYWAIRFSVGAVAAAALWAGLDVAVIGAHEARLPFLVLVVQSGWLGASSPRTSAFPAAALGQALIVLVPVIAYSCFIRDHFLQMLAPFGILQLLASAGITRTVGAQITAAILSEQRLEKANAQLTQLSSTDGLTGIGNRRAFETAFQTEWSRAARDGSDLGVLMIDVDCFKSFNDHYGHPAGDVCLRLVAQATAATLRRPPDTAARFGGEEFIALLPGADSAAAADVAERVRLAIMGAGVAHARSAFGRVTVSIGSASLAPHPGQDRQVLIDLADRALYEAKQSGRNTVCCAGGDVLIAALDPAVGSAEAY